ncbi:gliding motility-associated C-terminal domain-containing protein [Winogradskyella flava]|uniref:Gliding motility-associated C-terminal domain-containing protein n=1 Tax=Winogradskyella flava TaxID=1884876 RepID=A0A842IWZ5_9FLAO|nr:gliding motility-associated C-terminal domain-containing protein [Winogradskyella flava]MBC2846524.1 gliding motility-associated C-terminal domain-containing protein [Winogradskyella flava]
MNIIRGIALAIIVFFSAVLHAQCNLEETIVICDMTQIDSNNDGTPDGIINLYDEYTNLTGNTIQAGTWFDPGFNFALNAITGDLFLWDLNESSTTTTDYQFQLTNADCGSDIALTINLVLGPFSGIALPTNLEDVNVQVCDSGSTPLDLCIPLPDIDLFEALESLPSPHANGQWTYEGSSPNFIEVVGSELFVTVPYQAGPPLVDEETFELIYTVPGIAPCNVEQETRVKISVVREVFSGLAQNKRICEDLIVNGVYDNDIDLTDDDYLLFEDIEGTWSMDMFGQISTLGDSVININAIYQQIISNNPRFGCVDVDFTYSVDQRSGVCDDSQSTISFKIYEYLRPFSQSTFPEFCEDDESIPATINLYDQLGFSNDNGVVYDYPSDSCTQWNFVSGPSDLGLVSNEGGCAPSIDYSYLAPVNLTGAEPGTYVFRYTVSPEINCNPDNFEVLNYIDACTSEVDTSGFCGSESAEVVIVVHPKNYAGEDTVDLSFCSGDLGNTIDLISLLNTNGIDDPIYVGPFGTWVDLDTGSAITSPFVLPVINDQQTFNFQYNITNANNCNEEATLSFTVFEQYQAGTNSTTQICSDDSSFNLFDLLGSNASTIGSWTGPNGFVSNVSDVIFDPSTFEAGDYMYSVPDNGGTSIMCSGGQATVTVTILQNGSAGSDMQATVCRSDDQLDLQSILDSAADSGGTFQDIDGTNALNGSIVNLSLLNEGMYSFQYTIQDNPQCTPSIAILTIDVIDVMSPNVENQTFCLADAATISDLEILSSAFDFMWYDTSTSTDALPSDLLLVDGEDYFVSAINSDGCESDRIQISVNLLPFNDSSCNDCEINDGISDNDDNENEVLDLCNLPVIFPEFEIKIYNRYGSIVYKGNNNTSLFDGTSNVSLTIGSKLPSGTYFYVFNPNDGLTDPFQGSVYLSR